MRFLLALLLIGLVAAEQPLPSLGHAKEIKARARDLVEQKGVSMAAAVAHYRKGLAPPFGSRQSAKGLKGAADGVTCSLDSECDGVCDVTLTIPVCAPACVVLSDCASGYNCFTDGWCYLDCDYTSTTTTACDSLTGADYQCVSDASGTVGYCVADCLVSGYACPALSNCWSDGLCYGDDECVVDTDCTGLYLGDVCNSLGFCEEPPSVACTRDSDCPAVSPRCMDFGTLGEWCVQCDRLSDCSSTQYCDILGSCLADEDCCFWGGDSIDIESSTQGCCPTRSGCPATDNLDICDGAAQLGFGLALVAAVLHAVWKA